MKWQEIKNDQAVRRFVLIPTLALIVLAIITSFTMRIEPGNYPTFVYAIVNFVVYSWFFGTVLIIGLQYLYLKTHRLLALVIFIGTIIILSLFMIFPRFEYSELIVANMTAYSAIGYIFSAIVMSAIVKPELKRHKMLEIQLRDLIILLIPLGMSWLIVGSLSYYIETWMSLPLVITSAILVGMYAVASGYWGSLPISTIVITTLSLFVIGLFSTGNYVTNLSVMMNLIVEFIVIMLGVYWTKKLSKHKKKSKYIIS